MAAQLRLRPVGRRSRNWNLAEEIRSREPPMHLSAPFSIIGSRGTGRNSLASRFSAMDADVLPQVDPQVFFNSFHKRIIRPHDSPRAVTVHLKAFICPPPVFARHLIPVFQLVDWNHFCCKVFLFDVARRGTFESAKRYMMLHEDLTTSFLVGNKCDLRPSLPQNRTVSKNEINEVKRERGITYYEISARTKEKVQSLLEAIQHCAFQERYLLNLDLVVQEEIA